MQTSNGGSEPIATAPHSDHPVQMSLAQDKDQDTPQVPTSSSTLAQASIHEAAPDPKTKKLSLEERLSRLSEYRIFESDIGSTAEPAGSGGKADVVRASLNKGARHEQVAVKKLRTDDPVDEKFSKEFVHEVELLAGLSHKNIVRLIGFVEDLKNQRAWVVLSWESNGHAREFLASGEWEIPERISLIKDMFAGLQYLHTRQPPICHGDLKSLNLLVSSSCRAVITDFGSARVLSNDENRPANRGKMQNAGEVAAADGGDSCPGVTVFASANQLTLTGPVWSLRWAAPELVKEEAQPGLASDIWSAAWVCWEMMTDRVPFEETKNGGAIMLKVIQGQVPMIDEDMEVAEVISLCSLMTDCWKYKAEDRPHVNQCCIRMQWMPSVPPLRETSSGSKEQLSLEERLSRLSEYRIFESEIESTEEPTGRGGKADVIRANFKRDDRARGDQVAVKKLRCHDPVDEKFSKEFVHEVELLAGLSHDNILQLVGFVEDLKHQKAWIVLSWERNGNVREFLASGKWELPERISLIKDMFNGLQYLHTRQPPICHGDLKSLNILVSSSCRAVITGFGSARVLKKGYNRPAIREKMRNAGEVAAADGGDSCPEVTVVVSANQLTLTGPVWSLRLAAPELIKDEARLGLASDIWSAGWVCWEMMTNRIPFEDLRRDGAVMLKVIQGNVPLVRENWEVTQVIRLCSLMMDCWKYKPENRPHVNQCCNEVQWMPSVPPLRETTSDRTEPPHNLLMQIGRMHYLQNRHENAAALFEKVVTNTEFGGSSETLAQALESLGAVRRAQCKYAEAEESYTRAQEIYARIGDDLGRASTLDGLGDVYRLQRKFAEAEESYTRAHEIYARIGHDQGQANTILSLGHVYRSQRKYAEAEESYTRAQEIYARIGDDQGRASTLDGLGDVYRLQRKYAEAEESYTRAHEIYARIGHDQGQANTILSLGHVYRSQRKYAEAEESYTRAQEIYARIGDDQGRANTIRGLGNVYRSQRKYAEAEESYTRAQDIYARIGGDLGRANTLRGLGHLYKEQGRRMDAAQSYTKARDLYSQLGLTVDADGASRDLDTVL